MGELLLANKCTKKGMSVPFEVISFVVNESRKRHLSCSTVFGLSENASK